MPRCLHLHAIVTWTVLLGIPFGETSTQRCWLTQNFVVDNYCCYLSAQWMTIYIYMYFSLMPNEIYFLILIRILGLQSAKNRKKINISDVDNICSHLFKNQHTNARTTISVVLVTCNWLWIWLRILQLQNVKNKKKTNTQTWYICFHLSQKSAERITICVVLGNMQFIVKSWPESLGSIGKKELSAVE